MIQKVQVIQRINRKKESLAEGPSTRKKVQARQKVQSDRKSSIRQIVELDRKFNQTEGHQSDR